VRLEKLVFVFLGDNIGDSIKSTPYRTYVSPPKARERRGKFLDVAIALVHARNCARYTRLSTNGVGLNRSKRDFIL
jgi:hypothetical protein